MTTSTWFHVQVGTALCGGHFHAVLIVDGEQTVDPWAYPTRPAARAAADRWYAAVVASLRADGIKVIEPSLS
jgi:hypothetical protein